MENRNLIPVYYIYDEDENEISISGKDYVDYMDCFADGANGVDGIVDSDRSSHEPYNYFYEINDAMWSLNHMELSEGSFDVEGFTLQQIISEMKTKGFEMICCPD